MSNLGPKINQTSIEINSNLHFSQMVMVKVYETLQTISKVKMNIFQMKILNKITLILFIICSFIKFKVLVSLPKCFHGLFGYENALQLVN